MQIKKLFVGTFVLFSSLPIFSSQESEAVTHDFKEVISRIYDLPKDLQNLVSKKTGPLYHKNATGVSLESINIRKELTELHKVAKISLDCDHSARRVIVAVNSYNSEVSVQTKTDLYYWFPKGKKDLCLPTNNGSVRSLSINQLDGELWMRFYNHQRALYRLSGLSAHSVNVRQESCAMQRYSFKSEFYGRDKEDYYLASQDKSVFIFGFDQVHSQQDKNILKVFLLNEEKKSLQKNTIFLSEGYKSVQFNMDNTKILIDGNTCLYWIKIKDGSLKQIFSSSFVSPRFSYDGDKVIAFDKEKKKVVLWKSDTGDVLQEIPDLPKETAVGFTPDDKKIIIASTGGSIIVWDLAKLTSVFSAQCSLEMDVKKISYDAAHILLTSKDNRKASVLMIARYLSEILEEFEKEAA